VLLQVAAASASGTFTLTGSLNTARYQHKAVLLTESALGSLDNGSSFEWTNEKRTTRNKPA
jgi:hypothetical protein